MTREVYVTQPHLAPLDEFVTYLEKIWQNKILTNCGPFHEQLERELESYLGVEHISLCSNGTLALIIALQSLELKGEVITTPYSFVATAHSLIWHGNDPVFIDVEPETLNIDPSRIEAAITSRTSAIMPVHCYGNPCDVDSIQQIAEKHNLKVVYDAAHAFAVRDEHGRSILRHGDLSVLSFHATKVFNTFEGGAIVCHDLAMKQRIDRLKNFGFLNETTVSVAGMNAKMSEINAAFGLAQLPRIENAIRRRREIDMYYRKYISDVEGVEVLNWKSSLGHNYSYFPILIKDSYPLDRDALYEMLRSHGLYSRRYFYPLISEFPMYRDLPSARPENLPVAFSAAARVICLPIYPELELDDAKRVVDVIRGA